MLPISMNIYISNSSLISKIRGINGYGACINTTNDGNNIVYCGVDTNQMYIRYHGFDLIIEASSLEAFHIAIGI